MTKSRRNIAVVSLQVHDSPVRPLVHLPAAGSIPVGSSASRRMHTRVHRRGGIGIPARIPPATATATAVAALAALAALAANALSCLRARCSRKTRETHLSNF